MSNENIEVKVPTVASLDRKRKSIIAQIENLKDDRIDAENEINEVRDVFRGELTLGVAEEAVKRWKAADRRIARADEKITAYEDDLATVKADLRELLDADGGLS